MAETTQTERDEVRRSTDENMRREFQIVPIPTELTVRIVNDADRLAQYESQCIARTEDMPEDAVTFHKDEAGECWLSDQHPIGPLLTGWDDLLPDEPGPLSRYIVDVE